MAPTLHLSIIWLCFHLKRPYVSANLCRDRICWSSALSSLYRGHLFSPPNHWERFWGQGRVSYAALTSKLSCTCGAPQMSALVMVLSIIFTHGVHAPCLPWNIAFIRQRYCFTWLTSSMTIAFLCSLGALDRSWTNSHLCPDWLT